MNEKMKDRIINFRSKGNDYYRISNNYRIPIKDIRYVIEKSKNPKTKLKDINNSLDQEEINIFKNLYNRKDLDINYIENKMGRTIDFLKKKYNEYVESKKIKTLTPDLEYTISRMIYAGFNYFEISETLNVNIDTIVDFCINGIDSKNDIDNNINIYKLLKFSKYKCKVGDIYRIRVYPIDISNFIGKSEYKDVKVLDKYTYIATTDKGDFTYLDLYNGIKIN